MRRDEFSEDAPGRLAAINGLVAFIPSDLPPELPFDREIATALGAARGALGTFEGVTRLVDNPELIMHPLMVRDAVDSNKIEGTHTRLGAVLHHIAAGAPDDPDRAADEADVLRCLDALRLGADQLSEHRVVTNTLIRSLHAKLLPPSDPISGLAPGAFREAQVYIGSPRSKVEDARFVPPPAAEVPRLMENLTRFLSDAGDLDPLIKCAVLHYQFETIHPFRDGNGRLGRILIPLHLCSEGLLSKPMLVLSTFLEARRENYVDLLKGVSTQNDWRAWILFFLEAVVQQSKAGQTLVNRVLEMRKRYRDAAIKGRHTKSTIVGIDLVMTHAFVSVPMLAQAAQVSYKTANASLARLEGLGIVRKLEKGHPQLWVGEELLHSIYTD